MNQEPKQEPDNAKDPIAPHFEQSLAGLARATHEAALRAGNKLLIIGNGGSADDAQHIAAEIIGCYKLERPGYAAMALATDTSALSAIANDYGFGQVFARQVTGLGQSGDVLLALSTSGRSPNILATLHAAREDGIVTTDFTGAKGDTLRELCDHLFVSPSDDTPVVQQIHLTAAHGICDELEQAMMHKAAAT